MFDRLLRWLTDLDPEVPMTVTADDTTAADLRETITNMAATASRLPAHWVDRRAVMHERINQLLDELETVERGTHV